MSKSLEGKRILSVIYGTELFGSERANLEALKAMYEQGAEIHVAVSGRVQGGGDVGAEARQCGFKTFEMPFGSHFARAWMLNDRRYRKRQIKRFWTNSRLLSQKIKEIKPTHLMFSNVLAFTFCCLATIVHRIPLIYRIGDVPPIDSRFQLFFWNWLVRRADHVVCVSDYIRKLVMDMSGKNERHVTRIHNIPISRNGAYDVQKCSELKKSKRPIQLLYVGQLTPQKGVDILVNAVQSCTNPDVGLWVVGGSSFGQEFERELEMISRQHESLAKIHFFGFAADPRPYYEAADWHIAPSTYPEPMANTTFEAKAAGVPSIVSNRGGFPEVIRHQIDGFILNDPLNEHSIVESIRWASEQMNHQHIRMKDAASSSISERFNRTTFTQNWMQIIHSTT